MSVTRSLAVPVFPSPPYVTMETAAQNRMCVLAAVAVELPWTVTMAISVLRIHVRPLLGVNMWTRPVIVTTAISAPKMTSAPAEVVQERPSQTACPQIVEMESAPYSKIAKAVPRTVHAAEMASATKMRHVLHV